MHGEPLLVGYILMQFLRSCGLLFRVLLFTEQDGSMMSIVYATLPPTSDNCTRDVSDTAAAPYNQSGLTSGRA